MNPATLRNWIEAGSSPSSAESTAESAEVKRLKRENAELRRANEILKTASAFFAAAEPGRRFPNRRLHRRPQGAIGDEQICRVLTELGMTISPSIYYARSAEPSTTAELADAYAAHEVFCLFHDQRGLYRVLKLWHSLRRRDRDVGRDRVARLMGICGIAGIVQSKRRTVTTESGLSADRHPDLIDCQWNTPTWPDQWWVAGFTYVRTLAGVGYVSFVVDVYSRRIPGWRESMTTLRGNTVMSHAPLGRTAF